MNKVITAKFSLFLKKEHLCERCSCKVHRGNYISKDICVCNKCMKIIFNKCCEINRNRVAKGLDTIYFSEYCRNIYRT